VLHEVCMFPYFDDQLFLARNIACAAKAGAGGRRVGQQFGEHRCVQKKFAGYVQRHAIHSLLQQGRLRNVGEKKKCFQQMGAEKDQL